MGVFSRFKDIISSNINSMLDHAEDPDKMIRLMIREMEETLVDLKASCAEAMAARKRVVRDLDGVAVKMDTWATRARLAVERGREDLAREALAEKRRLGLEVERLETELADTEGLVDQSQEDIVALESKLKAAREKQRLLVQRHKRARHHKHCRRHLRTVDSSDTMHRFERFERDVERMEADAAVEGPVGDTSLEEEFRLLEGGDDIERELDALRAEVRGEAKAGKDEKK